MRSPSVIVFLSTGRCGTQWLTHALRALYPGELTVEHEPLGPLYRPRRFFRRYSDPASILAVPEVKAHVQRIADEKRYVETGWPLFAALPLLAERFSDRLGIVHLTRHPVPTTLSHLAHSSYAGSPRDDAYTRLATLGPGDRNVFQPHYADRWHELTPYEKCLFWWTEVSLFGLELPGHLPGIPFIRIKSEDLLHGQAGALQSLLEFMGLRRHAGWERETRLLVDRWHHRTDREVDPSEVGRHPATVAAASELGYDALQFDSTALHARYRGRPDEGLDRVGRFVS